MDQVDLTDPQSTDRALRVAVADPAVLAQLDAWWQMVETRRAGNSTRNPGLGLEQSLRYLTDRLDRHHHAGVAALPVWLVVRDEAAGCLSSSVSPSPPHSSDRRRRKKWGRGSP